MVFDAYEAVPEGQEPGGNGKLVDSHRVPVDHTLPEQVVSSPEVRSEEPGLVYWRARTDIGGRRCCWPPMSSVSRARS